MRFVDTNVLLYAVSAESEESGKRDRAIALLQESDLAISVQVLQEFYHQATRPGRPATLTPEQALRFIQAIDGFPVQPVTLEVFPRGRLESAGASGCRTGTARSSWRRAPWAARSSTPKT